MNGHAAVPHQPHEIQGPFEDCFGTQWIYDLDEDRWVCAATIFDWEDMTGWHPEVISKWVARHPAL